MRIDLWANINHTNIPIIGVPEEKGAEKIFEEIIAESSPNLGKERHPGPGHRESPKQDEPREVHTKTLTKYNVKN